MRNSLRFRLTLWNVGVMGAVLVIFSAGFYMLLGNSFRQRLDGSLRSAVEVTALTLNHETEEHGSRASGEENFRMVLNTMHQTTFPRTGIAVWRGSELVAEKPGVASVAASSVPTAKAPSFLTIEVPSGRYRVAVADVWVAASKTWYRVAANESLAPIEAEMRTVSDILLVTVPICLGLAAIGGYFLARKSLVPILEMARTAEQISSHNLEQRLAVGNSRDELGTLAETFNRVFERLQQAFQQQRQFMADASHELRTPISVALIATQVSLESRQQPLEDLHETLEVVQSQMLRLRRVVEDMFMLAQADSGAFAPNRTAFYLDEVVSESIRAARVLGDARGVAIAVGPLTEEAEYSGDEGLLRQLVMILLDNAVKYTPAGGRVEVALSTRQSGYGIRVADTGCGIPPGDQPFVFDRFYRADKSRSRHQPGAGSGAGLGLAIAKWITELHDGSIRLERSDGQGTVVCVDLPLRAAYRAT